MVERTRSATRLSACHFALDLGQELRKAREAMTATN